MLNENEERTNLSVVTCQKIRCLKRLQYMSFPKTQNMQKRAR